ncbi:NIPSNAP family protein (plasmid) [Cupriavidus oxalaticus]|nr:NIPSNAP family protein [Cupriavidus oxalaticus]QBY56477.1 NIPSNAP family protein [Cupriavidus oxalaticus]
MLYELATLSPHPLHAHQVAANARDWVEHREASGILLGCWLTDIGPLGRVLLLRGFHDAGELARERQRTLHHEDPFGADGLVTSMQMDSYEPFPFLPPVRTGELGKVYEFRTYLLRPGGLQPTMAAWEAAMPARSLLSPLVVNMFALDGQPRITHIWPFASADARAEIRAKSYADGIWPPKGGPDQFFDAVSVLAYPTDFSPLR